MSYIKKYKSQIKKDFDQWSKNGNCQNAVNLNSSIGEDYFDTSNPHYFTGNLSSEIVLVQLNPKRNKEDYGIINHFKSFEEYWDFYERFGYHHYGVDTDRTHRSPFDYKQIRFLEPFNILPFKMGDKFYNLETVIDQKLQIELIPYGSPDFNYKKIGLNNINPFINSILQLILSCERKYVIFCGRVFCELLSPYIINQETSCFKLKKNDSTETRDNFELIKIKIKYHGNILEAAIAPQFAKQGAPIRRYGEKIAELYYSNGKPNQIIDGKISIPNTKNINSLEKSILSVDKKKLLNRRSFEKWLMVWYRKTDDSTIGDFENYGQQALLWVKDKSKKYKLNADTKRDAVKIYLNMLDQSGGFLKWTIAPNAKGRMNKVVFGDEKTKISGFYMYLI